MRKLTKKVEIACLRDVSLPKNTLIRGIKTIGSQSLLRAVFFFRYLFYITTHVQTLTNSDESLLFEKTALGYSEDNYKYINDYS